MKRSVTRSESGRPKLEYDDVLLELTPSVGGSISQLRHKGIPLLRTSPEGPHSVLDAASFPLVPIINRIPNGQFSFENKTIKLQPNLPGSPDFLHGQGWKSAWEVKDQTTHNSMTLQFHHSPGEWPWCYIAEQHFVIIPGGIKCSLSVTNTDTKNMPAGLGFHPYFLRTSATRVQTTYEGYWAANEALHPQHKVSGSYLKDWIAGASVTGEKLTDHTHYGFGGIAQITEPNRPTITIKADASCNNLHIYTPTDGPSFCLEPVTDRADPFNEEPRKINILKPGESYSVWMEITSDL